MVRKAQKWSNLAMFCGPDPTAGGFSGGVLVGLENRNEEGSVSMQFRGALSGAVEAVWDAGWQVFGHVGSRSWAGGGRSRSAAS